MRVIRGACYALNIILFCLNMSDIRLSKLLAISMYQ